MILGENRQPITGLRFGVQSLQRSYVTCKQRKNLRSTSTQRNARAQPHLVSMILLVPSTHQRWLREENLRVKCGRFAPLEETSMVAPVEETVLQDVAHLCRICRLMSHLWHIVQSCQLYLRSHNPGSASRSVSVLHTAG